MKSILFVPIVMSSLSLALPDKVTCRIATFSPQFKELRFTFPFDGSFKDIKYTSPDQKEYKVHLGYNKVVPNLNISVAAPYFGDFREISHALFPLVEKGGRIQSVHLHLEENLLEGESLVVECPPGNGG